MPKYYIHISPFYTRFMYKSKLREKLFKNPLDKEIIRLASPNIISNISIPLLGSIDLAIVGHLDSEAYIGAIALGTMIFNFIYWSFGFLRMGTSGLSSQAFGENQLEKQQKILFQGLFLALSFSILLILLQYPINKIAFSLISGGAKVETLASGYYYIRIWAAPATLSLYIFYGWFLGMQNSKIPMIIALSTNVINLLANLLFVYVFKMNSDGVALGTVVAQYSGLLMAFYYLQKKFDKHFHLQLNLKILIIKKEILQFLRLNTDIFIRTLCLIAVFTFFTSASAAQNDKILAVNTLLLQFFMFFSFFEDGFAYAAEALIGKFYGQKRYSDIKELIKKLFKWGLGVSLAFSLFYYFLFNFILHLLTNKENIIQNAHQYIAYILAIPLLGFASFIWDGIYIGATAARQMRNTMIFSTLILFFPLYYLFSVSLEMGNQSLWLAFLFFLIGRGLSQTFVACRENKKRLNVKFL